MDHEFHYPSGAMLFKFLMNKALEDNSATTTLYHNNLVSLEVHIGVVNSNVEQFKNMFEITGKH